MNKIIIVGVGGIGSYFCTHIAELISKRQVEDTTVDVYDFDKVDNKTIYYQNFSIDEIGFYKTDCISNRYGFTSYVQRVKFDKNFDLKINTNDKIFYILCVDNWQTRKEFFTTWFNLPNVADNNIDKQHIRWIDLRSHGKQISAYSYHEKVDKDRIFGTLPTEEQAKNIVAGNNSCQNPYDVARSAIQLGNVIIAAIGAQMFLNLYRNEITTTNFQYVI